MLCFYLAEIQDSFSNILCFYFANFRTRILASSVLTWHSLRLLFNYRMFLSGLSPECYYNILYFYLANFRTVVQISSVPTRHSSGLLFRYPLFPPSVWPRLLFRYTLFRLDKNRDCYSDILCFYPTSDQDCYSNILCFYMGKIWTAIQISSVSTWHKLGLLFKHPLFLPSLRPRLLFIYPMFLQGKFQDCCLVILYSFVTLIRTAIQISSVSTRPKSNSVMQISSVSA